MLYYLFYKIKILPVHIFKYVSVRGALGALIAFGVTLIIFPRVIQILRNAMSKRSLHQKDHERLTEIHSVKKGIPNMGGIVIIIATLVSVLLVCDLSNIYVLGGIYVVLAFGMMGFIDDYLKLFNKKSKGLTKTEKMGWQFFMTSLVAIMILYFGNYLKLYPSGTYQAIKSDTLTFPGFKNFFLTIGPWLYLAWAFVVIGGSSNGVNLTDGLDGLAIGCLLVVITTFSIIAYITGRIDTTEYLKILYVPGSSELVIFCLSITGACLGFLWYNAYPAQVFMGDTGALFLGAFAGYIALVTKQEMLLVLIGGIFVMETGSVILQVFSFRVFGKRIFKVAPLHHHFEIKGLKEPKITIRFWIVQVILALLCLCSLKLR